jgi:hypothetical protein
MRARFPCRSGYYRICLSCRTRLRALPARLYEVKVEAANEDIHIEPPDVDVECVEEAAE